MLLQRYDAALRRWVATPLGRALWLTLAAMAWTVLGVARALHTDPRGFGTHEQLGLAPCGFQALTGLACPGCGLTTAITAMAHAQWRTALHAHPMGVLLFFWCVAFGLGGPWAAWRGRPVLNDLFSRTTTWLLGATALTGTGVMVLRWV